MGKVKLLLDNNGRKSTQGDANVALNISNDRHILHDSEQGAPKCNRHNRTYLTWHETRGLIYVKHPRMRKD